MATNNTNSQAYQFSVSENQTLDDCCTHAQSILNELKQNGYATKPITLKCPMEELQSILRNTNSKTAMKKKVEKKPAKSKTKLTGIELNDYLESKIVADSKLSNTVYPCPDLIRNPVVGNLNQIISSIKNRLENIGKLTARSTHLYFELGFYLQTAYKVYKICSAKIEVKLQAPGINGWQVILESAAHIHASYGK